MVELNQNRKPTFFWQGVLILLPVAIMGVLAAGAVIKDRIAAEQEMRQRAQSLLEQINRDFANKLYVHCSNWEVATWGLFRMKQEGSLFPPGDIFGSSVPGNDTSEDKLITEVPPSLIAAESLIFNPTFNPNGSMRPIWKTKPLQEETPGNEPPHPPKWRLGLTAGQLAAWVNLNREATASNNVAAVREAVRKFKETNPGPDAIENAEFIEVRTVMEASPTPVTAKTMLNTRFAMSETGIPLSSLGLAEALKRYELFKDGRGLWDDVALDARNKPNFLTPALAQLAEPLTQKAPILKECLATLEARWLALEKMWTVGELIQQSGQLQGTVATNFWLESAGQSWFCFLQPGAGAEKYDDGHGNIITNLYTQSRVSSLAVVTWAFKQSFNDMRITVPAYLDLTVELAGAHPVRLSPAVSGAGDPQGQILAQISGRDQYMGNAEYILRIRVRDARLMLAAQRQRAVMIGGLLAVSMLAALIGFFAARRAFYRQLHLSEMKSNFVSSVSHELRAPIASVRLMAEGLERGKISGAEKQNEYFRFIVQECRRLSSLIENVLDFSRIEQGRKQYEFESTDLVALTEQTVKLMETYAAERQVEIGMEVKGEAVPVEIEGKAMQQALINLIDNAIKHSPKGAGIKVGVEFVKCGVRSAECGIKTEESPTQATARLWVEDKGVGIPAAEHEKIFERFYRIGSELRRETQGVGIGLSIVKHIVEAHRGKITVRSAPGEGSRFTIELPIENGGKI